VVDDHQEHNVNTTTNPIMPPIHESAPATAWRLRHRLRDLYPATEFRVVTRRDPRDARRAELVVTWASGPTVPEVLVHVEPFARTTALGRQVDATLWANHEGKVALVYPGAERVRLQREAGPEEESADGQ
jgi:hypothetical protein